MGEFGVVPPPEILNEAEIESMRRGILGETLGEYERAIVDLCASHEALRERLDWWRTARSDEISLDLAALRARVVALTAALAAVVEEFNKDDHTFRREPWNAPGHAHSVRERWDGWGETRHQQPCELCIAWNRARALSVTKPERCPTCRSTSPEFCYRGGRHTHGYHWFGDINVECCPDDFHRDGRVPRG